MIKPGTVKYRTLHGWLVRHFGNATKCEICGKIGTGRQIHWALIKGKEYEKKRENFWQLCMQCHLVYDNTALKPGQRLSPKTEIKKGQHLSKSTEFKKGHIPEFTPEHRKHLSEAGKIGWIKRKLEYSTNNKSLQYLPNSKSFQ